MERRSQRRLKAAISIQLHGTDKAGERFEETVETLDVSRRGLLVRMRRDLLPDDMVSVVVPKRHLARNGKRPSEFYATASVVRVDRDGDFNRVALRLVGATLPIYASEGG